MCGMGSLSFAVGGRAWVARAANDLQQAARATRTTKVAPTSSRKIDIDFQLSDKSKDRLTVDSIGLSAIRQRYFSFDDCASEFADSV